MHREDRYVTRDHAVDPPTPGCVALYSTKVRGLSQALYWQVLAVPDEHRFAPCTTATKFVVFATDETP